MQTTPKITHARRGLLATMVRFLRGRRGAVSPIMALALIPIVGAMGMGAEASNWWLTQRSAQNAADAAAMAAAVDAGANYVSGTAPSTVPANCTSASTTTTSWYCQAKAAAAKYSFVDGANNVTVTPSQAACPTGVTTYTSCVKVTVQQAVPLYLLSVVGFNGNTMIGASKAQFVSATAYAGLPGPPLDFCVLTLSTSSGAFGIAGGNSANLQGCSVFSDGTNQCNGAGPWGIQYSYSVGSTTTKLCADTTANNLTAPTSVSDPDSAVSALIPQNPSCTNPSQTSLNSSTFPSTNVITPSMVSGLGAGNTTISVCGNAAFGSSSAVGSSGVTGGNNSFTGNTCELNYSGSANVQIIVYNGSLGLNGCLLHNTGSGGLTIVFAPSSKSNGTIQPACTTQCTPYDVNSSGGILDIAAPTGGTYKGLAIVQSNQFTEPGGSACGGSHAGPLDWCDAGNSPTLDLQGVIYMPNANIGWKGAVSKFRDASGNSTGLNCFGMISNTAGVNGTGASFTFNNFTGLTAQCSQAGVTLPSIPGTHTFYQKLVA